MPSDWKSEQSKLRKVSEYAEEIARNAGFTEPPVDPFVLVANEGDRLKAYGDDFKNSFDGRLEYRSPRFMLLFNTKYDQWEHSGKHHPKVLFTVGHELGHYFLEHHRNYLMGGGGAHGSMTEFQSNRLVEREADCFAASLLMPKFLLKRIVNREPPDLARVRSARDQFQVSLTSMLVRWVQLCDFPCAIVSVSDGKIGWGFCSPGLKNADGYTVKRGAVVTSRQALKFLQEDRSLSRFRQGEGYGAASHWLKNDALRFVMTEHYLVIPSTKQTLVFLTADEDELSR